MKAEIFAILLLWKMPFSIKSRVPLNTKLEIKAGLF